MYIEQSIFLAITNVVNLYLDQPNVINQIRESDAKSPALEGYIYEAMRKCSNFYREVIGTDVSLNLMKVLVHLSVVSIV